MVDHEGALCLRVHGDGLGVPADRHSAHNVSAGGIERGQPPVEKGRARTPAPSSCPRPAGRGRRAGDEMQVRPSASIQHHRHRPRPACAGQGTQRQCAASRSRKGKDGGTLAVRGHHRPGCRPEGAQDRAGACVDHAHAPIALVQHEDALGLGIDLQLIGDCTHGDGAEHGTGARIEHRERVIIAVGDEDVAAAGVNGDRARHMAHNADGDQRCPRRGRASDGVQPASPATSTLARSHCRRGGQTILPHSILLCPMGLLVVRGVIRSSSLLCGRSCRPPDRPHGVAGA